MKGKKHMKEGMKGRKSKKGMKGKKGRKRRKGRERRKGMSQAGYLTRLTRLNIGMVHTEHTQKWDK